MPPQLYAPSCPALAPPPASYTHRLPLAAVHLRCHRQSCARIPTSRLAPALPTACCARTPTSCRSRYRRPAGRPPPPSACRTTSALRGTSRLQLAGWSKGLKNHHHQVRTGAGASRRLGQVCALPTSSLIALKLPPAARVGVQRISTLHGFAVMTAAKAPRHNTIQDWNGYVQ